MRIRRIGFHAACLPAVNSCFSASIVIISNFPCVDVRSDHNTEGKRDIFTKRMVVVKGDCLRLGIKKQFKIAVHADVAFFVAGLSFDNFSRFLVVLLRVRYWSGCHTHAFPFHLPLLTDAWGARNRVEGASARVNPPSPQFPGAQRSI